MSTSVSGTDVLYALAGVAVVGTIGYLIWKSSQDSALAAQHYAASQNASQTVSDYLSNASVLYSATNLIPSTPDPPPPPGGVPLLTPPTV